MEGNIPLNHDRIARFRSLEGHNQKDEIETYCWYDWTDDAQVDNAMFQVGRCIHKNVTKNVRNLDTLIEHEISLMQPMH